jgi:uncharacterized OB-fold protein
MTFQPLPQVTADTAAFWEGGADGLLRIDRCAECSTWFHPPAPVCPSCLSRDVVPTPTSGRATVQGFSVNTQPWAPDMEVPYVVAVVSVDDAPGVQLTTRLIDVTPADVTVGMHVEVTFLHVQELYLPLFRPARPEREGSALMS